MGLEFQYEERIAEEKKRLIGRFWHYLNDFDGRIPKQHIRGGGDYKVRGNWFNGVFSTMKGSLRLAPNENLRSEIYSFLDEYNLRRRQGAEAAFRGDQADNFVPTTREEIDRADVLLRKCIENLENQSA